MKKVIRLLLLAAVMFTFSGCWWCTPQIQKEIVYVDKITLVVPPDSLLTKVEVSRPPSRTKFIESNNLERMNMLSIYSVELLNDTGTANSQLTHLREWKTLQMELYADKNNTTITN